MRSIPVKMATKFFTTLLTIVFFFSSTVLGSALETNFWAERQKERQSHTNGHADETLLASLPAHLSPLSPHNFSQQQALKNTIKPKLPQTVVKNLSNKEKKEFTPLLETLSNAYSTIRQIQVPKNNKGPIVVHIQDVHMNQEAQTNIGKVVQKLIEEEKIDLIALEGAFQEFDFSRFRNFDEKWMIEAAADYLLKVGKISGPIHTALTTRTELPKLVGIDHRDHYKANVQAFLNSRSEIDSQKKKIERAEREVNEKKNSLFNKELQKFDSKVQAYRLGRITVGDYAEYLYEVLKESDKLSVSPNFLSFLEAAQMELTLDFDVVERERARLIEGLLPKLNEKEISALINHSTAYKLGHIRHTDFYTYLSDLCEKKGISLTQFKAMRDYLQYVLLADSLDMEPLFKEVRDLEKTAYHTLAQSKEEKELIKKATQIYLTKKLVDFSLTPEEWEEYKKAKIENRKLKMDDPFSIFHFPFSPFERFYENAEVRDNAITENLLNAISEKQARVAVLVTGGFHAPGIGRNLTEAGFTTISVVPKISKVEKEDGSPAYLSVFTQEKTPLEKLFQGEKLFVSPHPGLGIPYILPKSVAALTHLTRPGKVQQYFGEVRPAEAEGTVVEASGDDEQGVQLKIAHPEVHGEEETTVQVSETGNQDRPYKVDQVSEPKEVDNTDVRSLAEKIVKGSPAWKTVAALALLVTGLSASNLFGATGEAVQAATNDGSFLPPTVSIILRFVTFFYLGLFGIALIYSAQKNDGSSRLTKDIFGLMLVIFSGFALLVLFLENFGISSSSPNWSFLLIPIAIVNFTLGLWFIFPAWLGPRSTFGRSRKILVGIVNTILGILTGFLVFIMNTIPETTSTKPITAPPAATRSATKPATQPVDKTNSPDPRIHRHGPLFIPSLVALAFGALSVAPTFAQATQPIASSGLLSAASTQVSSINWFPYLIAIAFVMAAVGIWLYVASQKKLPLSPARGNRLFWGWIAISLAAIIGFFALVINAGPTKTSTEPVVTQPAATRSVETRPIASKINDYLNTAVDKQFVEKDNDAALELLNTAVKAVDQVPEEYRMSIILSIAERFFYLPGEGNKEESQKLMARAINMAKSQEDPKTRDSKLSSVAHTYAQMHLFDESEAVISTIQDPETRIKYLDILIGFALHEPDFDRAEKALRKIEGEVDKFEKGSKEREEGERIVQRARKEIKTYKTLTTKPATQPADEDLQSQAEPAPAHSPLSGFGRMTALVALAFGALPAVSALAQAAQPVAAVAEESNIGTVLLITYLFLLAIGSILIVWAGFYAFAHNRQGNSPLWGHSRASRRRGALGRRSFLRSIGGGAALIATSKANQVNAQNDQSQRVMTFFEHIKKFGEVSVRPIGKDAAKVSWEKDIFSRGMGFWIEFKDEWRSFFSEFKEYQYFVMPFEHLKGVISHLVIEDQHFKEVPGKPWKEGNRARIEFSDLEPYIQDGELSIPVSVLEDWLKSGNVDPNAIHRFIFEFDRNKSGELTIGQWALRSRQVKRIRTFNWELFLGIGVGGSVLSLIAKYIIDRKKSRGSSNGAAHGFLPWILAGIGTLGTSVSTLLADIPSLAQAGVQAGALPLAAKGPKGITSLIQDPFSVVLLISSFLITIVLGLVFSFVWGPLKEKPATLRGVTLNTLIGATFIVSPGLILLVLDVIKPVQMMGMASAAALGVLVVYVFGYIARILEKNFSFDHFSEPEESLRRRRGGPLRLIFIAGILGSTATSALAQAAETGFQVFQQSYVTAGFFSGGLAHVLSSTSLLGATLLVSLVYGLGVQLRRNIQGVYPKQTEATDEVEDGKDLQRARYLLSAVQHPHLHAAKNTLVAAAINLGLPSPKLGVRGGDLLNVSVDELPKITRAIQQEGKAQGVDLSDVDSPTLRQRIWGAVLDWRSRREIASIVKEALQTNSDIQLTLRSDEVGLATDIQFVQKLRDRIDKLQSGFNPKVILFGHESVKDSVTQAFDAEELSSRVQLFTSPQPFYVEGPSSLDVNRVLAHLQTLEGRINSDQTIISFQPDVRYDPESIMAHHTLLESIRFAFLNRFFGGFLIEGRHLMNMIEYEKALAIFA